MSYDKSQSKEVLIILIYAVINLSAQIIIPHLNENTPLPPNVTSVFKIFKVCKH